MEFFQSGENNLKWLLNAPIIQTAIVGKKGMMANMRTVDSRAFVLYNLWVADQKNYAEKIRAQASYQAKLVMQLIKAYLPNFEFVKE
jgi:hypothetical protein